MEADTEESYDSSSDSGSMIFSDHDRFEGFLKSFPFELPEYLSLIREKALINLNEEVPHGIAVTIESVSERDTKEGEPIMDITATIFCEKDSHKGILIGKGGSMLRKIGSEARQELEDFFRIRVNLQCWVKVKEGWRNREGIIRNFGLD